MYFDLTEFGKRLHDIRVLRGLTQEELAGISGISLRMIRAYEQKSQDISKASFATVSRLESVLHTKLGEC